MTDIWPTGVGLYTNGMHDYLMRIIEIGERAAHAEDDEACGFGPLFDAMVDEDIRKGVI